jgi:hypothetical protein
MSIGVVFATTGGPKIERCLRSFARIESDLHAQAHVVLDATSNTWLRHPRMDVGTIPVRSVSNGAHINGILNHALHWMKELGHSHALMFHDDLIFSPLPQHQGSISKWLDIPQVLSGSGISFGHFETFTQEGRRPSEIWDYEDLEGTRLWNYLASLTEPIEGGVDLRPPGVSYWFRSEGADKVRKWNRLGPTGQIVPISTWESVGRFDETAGIFYDQEYPSECFRRKLPPIWAVPNFPWIHLHNQSMNPWGDPAPNAFSNTGAAYEKRFGARDNRAEGWAGFWGSNWEEEWEG